MWKIIATNLKERWCAYLAFGVELVLFLTVGYQMLNDLVPYLQQERMYRTNQLDHIVYFSVRDGESVTEQDITIEGVSWLGENLNWKSDKKGTVILPVDEQYFSYMKYDYSQSMDMAQVSGNKAVIPRNMAQKYVLGGEYTITIDVRESITFTVVGILKDDNIFEKPSGMEDYMAVSGGIGDILLVPDEETEKTFSKAGIYMLWLDQVKDKKSVMEQLNDMDIVEEVRDLEDCMKYLTSLERTSVATPMVLFVTALLVCIVSFWSHILLSVVYFRRKYNICYICGLTWTKCLCLQWISDAIPTVLAIGVTIPTLYQLSDIKPSFLVLGVCVAVTGLLYLMGELIGIVFLRQKNIMENMEEIV